MIPRSNPEHPLFFVTSNLGGWLNIIFENSDQVTFGEFGIKLYGKDEYLNSIRALLFFLSKYGGIGARNQYGFGQFKICDSEHEREYEENWIKLTKIKFPSRNNRSSDQENLPSIENFIFLKYRIEEDSPLVNELKGRFRRIKAIPNDFDWAYIPMAPDLRYKGILEDKRYLGIRNHFREKRMQSL